MSDKKKRTAGASAVSTSIAISGGKSSASKDFAKVRDKPKKGKFDCDDPNCQSGSDESINLPERDVHKRDSGSDESINLPERDVHKRDSETPKKSDHKKRTGTDVAGASAESRSIAVSGGKSSASKGIDSLAWVKASKGVVPPNAVSGGLDKQDRSMYVARVTQDGDLLPGKLIIGHKHCVIYVPSKAGKEMNYSDYEVLTNPGKLDLTWVSTKKGSSQPGNAVPGGKTKDGETLFIGRHTMEKYLAVGYVKPSTQILHLAWAGNEHKFKEYEILVWKC